MSKFPSKNTYSITLLVLLAFLTLDFILDANNLFFQLNYSWDKEKTITKNIEITIDSLSYDYLSFKKGDIDINKLNEKYTFCLNDKYYYRCVRILDKNNVIRLIGGFWINNRPKKTEIKGKRFVLKQVELPIQQSGKKTVCMIGDSQITWLYGKNTRKEIYESNKDIKFVGDLMDLYGFPYQSDIFNNSQKVLNTIKSIPKAEIYIIFLGAHETTVKETIDNIISIIDILTKRNSKTILVNPPKYLNENKTTINENFSEIINLVHKNKLVSVIDLSTILKTPEQFLLSDGIHLNKSGHSILTEQILNFF